MAFPGSSGVSGVTGLSGSLEDYLRIIGEEVRKHGVARVRDIARALDVKAPSVTSAMKRLAGLGLVDYAQREYVQLTSDGAHQAQRIESRRKVLCWFFEEVLMLPDTDAVENACAIEHVLSAKAMDRLVSLFEFVRSCPAGREVFIERYQRCPIIDPKAPACEVPCSRKLQKGRAGAGEAMLTLAGIKPGEQRRVIRVDGRGALRLRLIELGFLPDQVLTVERIGLRGDPIWVRIAGLQVALRRSEARAVLVSPPAGK